MTRVTSVPSLTPAEPQHALDRVLERVLGHGVQLPNGTQLNSLTREGVSPQKAATGI